jgi:hypothetical protein
VQVVTSTCTSDGSVLKVEMTSESRDFIPFTIGPDELIRVAYLHIENTIRKTICFSTSIQMHDIVIGVFVSRYAFGRAVC